MAKRKKSSRPHKKSRGHHSADKKKKSYRLASEELLFLKYWRNSILDGDKIEIDAQELKDYSVPTQLSELQDGNIGRRIVKELEASKEKKKSKQGARAQRFERQDVGEFKILICPLRLRKTNRNALGPRFVEPFWVPATLHADGRLSPPFKPTPWIPRTLLEPLPPNQYLVIGTVDDEERFTSKYSVPDRATWAEYWQYCENFFLQVAGQTLSDFALQDFERLREAYLINDGTIQGSTHILRLYDDVIDGKRSSGLIPHLASAKKPNHSTYSNSKRTIGKSALKHLGQFEASFALSPSQRNAAHRYFELAQNDLLCVTGPPGTGKTTLLQSIIASNWVSAALSQAPTPPVVMACAATNQAVMNIIHSFGKTQSKPGPLSGRWLPGIHSYGRFCVSASKVSELSEIHYELSDGSGLSKELENWEYLRSAHAQYLKSFAKYSGKKKSLKKAVAHLHRDLKKQHALFTQDILRFRDGSFTEFLKGLVRLPQKIDAATFLDSLSALDTTRRHRMFQLATHYWEGRWLLEVAKELGAREKENKKVKFRDRKRDWQIRAMITPTFVSTFSMAPRFFGGRGREPDPFVDLLIIDEAGQASPEIGVASFALAKQAVVVGDDEQLEPVWNIPRHIDHANLRSLGLIKKSFKEDPKLKNLEDKGALSSSGNIMRLAIKSCRWIDNSTIGVFLSEHRRSVPELVAFCNKLSYRNRLIPKRPSLESRILPALGYAHITGQSAQNGRSRVNRIEADSLADWIVENESRISSFYSNQELDELVAVISPFAAQTRYLTKILRPRYSEMTVGTVHSLQGAERPIVLFSPVYDQSFEGTYFFDRGTNMLNVAVSRAKDSFLVFGDMGIFSPTLNTPSGILSSFLFADPNNEIGDIEPAHRAVAQEVKSERLTTLKQHVELLREAFSTARSRIILVSPTISSAAINADKLSPAIKQAVNRGVEVHIYTDNLLDLDRDNPEKLKPRSQEGRELLLQSGAKLFVLDRIHNKSLAIDNHTLVDGSFNWLSAVRTMGSQHQKLEISICHRGEAVDASIENLLEILHARVIG